MVLLSLLLLSTGWLFYKAALNMFMILLLINIFVEQEQNCSMWEAASWSSSAGPDL